MKSYTLALAGVLPALSFCSPVISSDIEVRHASLSPAGSKDLLLPRILGCNPGAGTVVSPPGLAGHNWRGYVAWVWRGTAVAEGWCLVFGKDCSLIATAVGLTLDAIVEGAYLLKNKGNTGGVDVSPVRRRASLASQMEQLMRARGVEFDSISVMSAGSLLMRDNGVSSTMISVLGVRDASSGVAVDHLLTLREDGTGTVSVRKTPDSKLARRHDGPGLKISYKVIQMEGGPIDMANVKLLTRPIGDDWQHRFDQNLRKEVNEYIGSLGLGDGNELGFRIIPEIDGFGEDYEDVEVCGKVD